MNSKQVGVKTIQMGDLLCGICPLCGGILPVATLVSGQRMLVQPQQIPVCTTGSIDPQRNPKEDMKSKMKVELGYVPHSFLCPAMAQQGLPMVLLDYVKAPVSCSCGHYAALHREGTCLVCDCRSFSLMFPKDVDNA